MTIEFDGQNNKLGTTTADSVTIKTNDTDALTVDTSQNVGIGTSSPSRKLHISTTAQVTSRFTSSNTKSLISIEDTNTTGENYVSVGSEGNNMILRAGGNERMRIDSSGDVLIGTTSTNSNEKVRIKSGNDTRAIAFQSATSAEAGYIYINSGGTSVSYSTSSDYRLKENVVDLTSATDRLKQLQPKRFNFIADADTTVDGFLAHEVSSVVPEAINGTHNEVEVWKEGEELPEGVSVGDNKLDDEGNTIPVYQGIDQSKLVPLLTASLQEALTEIDNLKARIEALENV